MGVFPSVLAQYRITKYRVPFETKFNKSDWIIPEGRVHFYRQIQDQLKMSDHEQDPFIGYSIMGTVFIAPSSPKFSPSVTLNVGCNVPMVIISILSAKYV